MQALFQLVDDHGGKYPLADERRRFAFRFASGLAGSSTTASIAIA
ncbi:MAG: hypothetical protein OXC14_11580 [Rhodospirillaceae bacterium]|nr:hypothetical protein [Rhodospirillaceae bacterium]